MKHFIVKNSIEKLYKSEPYIKARFVMGNGYGQYCDIDNSDLYTTRRSSKMKLKIRLPDSMKDLNTKYDSEGSGSDTEKDIEENTNSRESSVSKKTKQLIFIGCVYAASIALIVVEYFMFSGKSSES